MAGLIHVKKVNVKLPIRRQVFQPQTANIHATIITYGCMKVIRRACMHNCRFCNAMAFVMTFSATTCWN